LKPGSDLKLNIIGQVQLEVHTELGKLMDEDRDLSSLFEHLETGGLRHFHNKKIIGGGAWGITNCMEYAFVQEDWFPDKKIYFKHAANKACQNSKFSSRSSSFCLGKMGTEMNAEMNMSLEPSYSL
jgi:hypothetical protein